MAHDVWLLRSTLITCLLFSALAGTALASKSNSSMDQIVLSDSRDRGLTLEAQKILGTDNSFEDIYQAKQRTDFVHDGAAQVRSANMRFDSIARLETKRNRKEVIEGTGARKTRMQILDKYFVHPDIIKDKSTDRNSSNKDEEASLPALVLEGPRSSSDKRDLVNRELRKETSDIEKYGAASVEGKRIVNTASLLQNSSTPHVGDSQGSVRFYLPTQERSELLRAKLKLRPRYRFLNSLIRPQLAGISDDINDLDDLRNRTKSISLKTLKNSLKSESGGQFSEGSALIAEYTLNDRKQKASMVKERNKGSDYNTKMETNSRSNTNDMFLLGSPDKSSYFENAFLAYPEIIHSKPGLPIRLTPHWQKHGATTALGQGEGLNEAFGKSVAGGSDTTVSGLEGFVHPEDESGPNESGLGSDAKFNAALNLAIQSDMGLKKATSGVSLLSLKDKALSHIEESNDMNNVQKFKEDYRAGNFNDSSRLEDQITSPTPYVSPTKMGGFPKIKTTESSLKRTTIPHWKFGSQDVYQSTTSGSGEGSGSGEYYVPLHKSHVKQKHAQRIAKVSLSIKNKTHAGIFGAQDKETVKKCERMGKADYRDKCPSGWLPFDEFCYLFVTKSNGKWEEFPLKCNDENGLLAMPKTDKELKFLKRKISSLKQRKTLFYIGLKKKSETWTWIDDVPYTRDVHVKDELGDKNCAALSKDGVHMVTCSEPKAGYICEIRTGVEVFRVLAFGDSLTNGFHSDDKSYTPYAQTLEYLLNKDVHRCYTLTTIAKDGTEAAEMSTRLQDHLRDAKFKYSWVIILAGTNDIAHNSQISYRKAWDTAVERIINLHITSHRYGAKTVAVTIPEMDCEESKRPACLHTHLERKYINEKLRYYARSNEFTILCDLAVKLPRYSLSIDERKLMWEVGLHMKPAGYERMAEIIYKDLLANI